MEKYTPKARDFLVFIIVPISLKYKILANVGGSRGGNTTFLTGIVRPCFGVRPSLGLGYENFRQLMLVKPDLRLRLPLKRDELGFGKNLRARRAWRADRLNYACRRP